MLGKLKNHVLTLIGMLALTVLFTTGCTRSGSDEEPYYSDEEFVTETIEGYLNPSFGSIQEVLEFRTKLVEEYLEDEVFRDLPETTLINVTKVCLKKNNYANVSKKDLVEEYRANSSVYDNLTATPPMPEDPQDANKQSEATPATKTPITSAVEEQQGPIPIKSDYYYRIDTVNGHPKRVLVKEEIYESK